VAIAQEHGVHAKLTGAGGGGCALVYLPQSRETDDAALCAALEAAGFETWLTQLGNTGLTLTVA
jgi:mevalonate kinase